MIIFCVTVFFMLQKIDHETEEFLQKLKTQCLVALVGGSDLVKIAEQMGGDDGKQIIFILRFF